MRKTNLKVQKDRIRLSVRELVEYVLKHGDLKSSFAGFKRALEGTIGHQIVQRRRGDSYRREVRVFHILNDHPSGISLEIQGRIDGVFKEEDRHCIEEIKTTHEELESISPDENGLHLAQAKTYAYLYASQFDLEEVDVHLTYYQVKSSQTKTFIQHFTCTELETFFTDIVEQYLEGLKELYDWKEIRDKTIAELEFPYSGYRSGQKQFMNEVYRSISKEINLFAQAPTGLGKTISVLFPSIKAIGEGLCSKVFYLTARTTTREAPEQALEQLRTNGLRLKSIVITAKEKTCLQDEMICSPDHCEYLFNYFGKINSAIRDAYTEDHFNYETIERYARKHKICPFELSLDLSVVMDCIICDYNYFFDPRIQLARYNSEGVQPFVYLVDEAHNLVERSRSMYSAVLQKRDFLALKRLVDKEVFGQLHQSLQTLDKYLLEVRKNSFEEGEREKVIETLPEEFIDYLIDFLEPVETLLNEKARFHFKDALLELYYQVVFFIKINQIRQESDAYAITVSQSQSNLTIKLFCLNAAEMIKKKTEKGISTVFFSATLSPGDYFYSLLGGNSEDLYLQIPSPFPDENRCLCLVDNISTRYRDRENTYGKIADYIATYLKQHHGNYLVFFPSYNYLEEVLQRCLLQIPEVTVIRQESQMSEKEREAFIAEFTEDREQTLAGFAVMGGIFGESIDLPGDRLTGTVIVGVGLPQVNLERNLIKDYHDQRSGKGFHYSYTYPGLNKVLQAAGRLIRTETDQGSLLLIDDRFGNGLYRRLYPPEWKNLNTVRDTLALDGILDRFWK